VNREPGLKSWFFVLPPYFYFRFRCYGHRGHFCLIFAHTAQWSVLDGTDGLSRSKPCAYFCIVWSSVSYVCLSVCWFAWLLWALSDLYCQSRCLSLCLSVCLSFCPLSSPVHPLSVGRFGWNLAVRTHLGSNSLLWSFRHWRPLAAELWTKNLIFRGVTPNASSPAVLNLVLRNFGTMES